MGSVQLGIFRLTTASVPRVSIMMRKQLQVLLAVLIGVILQHHSVQGLQGLKCWRCTNFEFNPYLPYDVNCGNDNYVGDDDHIEEDEYADPERATCVTRITDDGEISRWLNSAWNKYDGQCDELPGEIGLSPEIQCFCVGEFCNNMLCEDCVF